VLSMGARSMMHRIVVIDNKAGRHLGRIARVAGIADRTRHAGATALAGTVPDPRAIRMVLTDP
jgi:hypothetical protein